MTDNLTIWEAIDEDLPILLEFEQGVIHAERPFDVTIRPDPVWYYDLKELMDSDTAFVVVALVGSEIVSCGYAMYKKARPYLDHEAYAYLGFMFTRADFRGKGINAKILDVLKKWAHQRGLSEIRLTVYDENIPAIKAYEKYGFKKHIIEMRLPKP